MKAIEKHPLSDGYPPTWASAWGQDRCGVWVEVEVGPVVQRLRWIPGGVFWMGSPDDEAGRADWEWPRHQVELAEGFWLADTPCTQELWQEVMGSNPSEFISPRRPVESISWDDCQQFLASLNERIPGLAAQLPTEAQWERACRAGTETPNWVGDLEVLGENNAPLLDSIAWYGGNSGVDFDLSDGQDSSGWVEKQYPHGVAGSREVRLKKANPWGLYDMLGNVWERCSDEWRNPQAGETPDLVIGEIEEGGSLRVLRGGSWFSIARYLRASLRLLAPAGDRGPDIGFRWSPGREK